jgi:hypothetical protein
MGEAVDQDLVAAMRGMDPVNLAIGLSGSFRKTLLAVNEIKALRGIVWVISCP